MPADTELTEVNRPISAHERITQSPDILTLLSTYLEASKSPDARMSVLQRAVAERAIALGNQEVGIQYTLLSSQTENVERMESVGRDLLEVTDGINKAASRMNDASEQMDHAASKQLNTIEPLEHAASTISVSSQRFEEATHGMDQTARQIQQAAEQFNDASHRMSR